MRRLSETDRHLGLLHDRLDLAATALPTGGVTSTAGPLATH